MALEAGKAATGHDRTAGPVGRPAQGPKRWKHFLITVMGVYPLTVLIPISLTWLAHYLPGPSARTIVTLQRHQAPRPLDKDTPV
jgi:antibiotic biosynthesis monooxygenase (ABM) superfamily enzyme